MTDLDAYRALRQTGATAVEAVLVMSAVAEVDSEIELVGPKGYIHGWIKVGGGGFAQGLQPGSDEHLRAIVDPGDRAANPPGDPAHRSPTMQTALHNLARSVAARDMKSAQIHLQSAKWANKHEAGGLFTRDLAELETQLPKVPRGVSRKSASVSPLSSRGQHPGRYVDNRGGIVADPTAGALRIPEFSSASALERAIVLAAVEEVELASDVWRRELRGKDGRWMGSGASPRARIRTGSYVGQGRAISNRVRQNRQAAAEETVHSAAALVAEDIAKQHAQKVMDAATAKIDDLNQSMEKEEGHKARVKLAVHIGVVAAGAALAAIEAKLGTNDIVSALSGMGPLAVQELVDWKKQLLWP
jgi:hypothetical protein